MNNLFIDTSGWASLFITQEPSHLLANQVLNQALQQRQTLITSNYIISELVALLHSPLRQSRSRIFEIIDAIKTVPYVQIIHLDQVTDQTAWELCKSRSDKPWSLVDCSSFVLMQQLNIQQAFTTDHHFEQAGFIRLLR
ncbi:MAG: PIN domain-containing protein [Leptolyngbya sp. Prado105]|jgi:predicted nucleic acid-binding protein|nr:PIN domain-containing protein [Leptolyngbya sp. Prado105]